MSEQVRSEGTRGAEVPSNEMKTDGVRGRGNHQRAAAGGSIAAAIIMLTVGVLSVLQGISAVAKDELLVAGYNYIYELDVTGWGWVHIVVGALLILGGLGLMTGAAWARVAAVVIAAVSIVANFLWLPYYPLWAILIIAVDLVVIWAVTTWEPTRT